MPFSLPYDSRCLDPDGLPYLGEGEGFYNVSFALVSPLPGESEFVEGVVAAKSVYMAGGLLISAEARFRLLSYPAMLALTDGSFIAGRISRDVALEYLPKVRHRVSMWKASCAA